jgi:YfiH family protein
VAEADAAICTTPGILLAVRVADCVPVLVASPHGVAVAHAGWRGAAAGVVSCAVAALVEETGDSPTEMTAAIGPHISGRVFEVGDEVVEALRKAGIPERLFLRERPHRRPLVDLCAAVEWQLLEGGVLRVDPMGLCTVMDHRFFSHRREGPHTGRTAGIIGLRRP